MKIALSLTPTDNINYEGGHVIDPHKVRAVTFQDEDLVSVVTSDGIPGELKVAEVDPTYMHVYLDGTRYHILGKQEIPETPVETDPAAGVVEMPPAEETKAVEVEVTSQAEETPKEPAKEPFKKRK